MSKCFTPGCDTAVPKDGDERQFCERCGWPLGQATISVIPEQIRFQGLQPSRIKVSVLNEGAGTLAARLKQSEHEDEHLEVKSSQSLSWDLTIEPTADDHYDLEILTKDRKGNHGTDFRMSLDDCWRTRRHSIPVHAISYGPLVVPHKEIVFLGPSRASGALLHNKGGTSLTVRITAPEGYTVSVPGTQRLSSQEIDISANAEERLDIRRNEQHRSSGELKIEVAGLPDQTIRLHYVPQKSTPPPSETVIAIDFGTSKSAVMVYKQGTKNAQPVPVLWERPGKKGEGAWFVPSTVVWEDGRPARFGWDVDPAEAESARGDKRVYSGLKMLLRKTNDPQLRQCVVYFLKKLLTKALDQLEFRSCADVILAITLPVLDNDGPEAEMQRSLTLQCLLEAGAAYGLTADQCSFFKEPECAAIDFLNQLNNGRADTRIELQPRDWICILDMGGGTTDITLAQLDEQGGKPSFASFHSLGYDNFGGDRVNGEFLTWCFTHWEGKQRLQSDRDADIISLKGENEKLTRAAAQRQLGELKELIYATDPPQEKAWETFGLKANELVLDPVQLRAPLVDLARQMFELGIPGRFPSLKQRIESLADEGVVIRALDVKLLCLTGGTCNISLFKEQLLDSVLTAKGTQVLRDAGPRMRQNVVRGAALRPSYRFQGQLALPFFARLHSESQTVEAELPIGSLPGRQANLRVWAAEMETVDFSVETELPDKGRVVLYQRSFPGYPGGECHAEAVVRYTSSGKLDARLQWDTAEELNQQILPWESIWNTL